MNNNYIYDLVKKKIEGFSYISQFVRLKKIGSIYQGVCPFHNEKTSSFTVYPNDYNHNGKIQNYTSFYCFGCGAGGDISDFVKLKDNYSTKLEACYSMLKEIGIVHDDENLIKEILNEQINSISNYEGNFLRGEEVNLICSSICRNYLFLIKEYYNGQLLSERKIIEKYYKHFENILSNGTLIEINNLVDETQEKIKIRIEKIKNIK